MKANKSIINLFVGYVICILSFQASARISFTISHEIGTGVPLNLELNSCEIEIVSVESSCNGIIAVAETNADPESIIWQLGNWYSQQGPNLIFTEQDSLPAGTYDLCAFIESAECPQAPQSCTTVTIEDCNDPCDLTIEYEIINGNEYIFNAVSNNSIQSVSWTINGNYIDFTESLTTLLGLGENQICASFETPECPFGNTACIDLYLPEEECEDVTFMFNLLDEFDGFAELLLQIEGNGQEIIESIEFSDDCTSASITLCLPPGCYLLTSEQDGMNQVPMWFGMHTGNELIHNESGMNLTLDMEFGVASECANSLNEQENLEVNVYPNPVSDQLNVVLSRWASGNMEIYSANGRLIQNDVITGYTKQFDMSGLSGGMYHLRLTDTSNPMTIEVQHVIVMVQ